MKTNHKKILFIVVSTIIYSIANIYFSKNPFDYATTFIVNCIILLVLSFIISGVLSIFRLKKWGFLEVFYRSHIVALVLGALSIIGNYGNEMDSFADQSQKDKYKKTVNETNEKPVKKIGDVKMEFLNDDNLYENYVYNYAIKFPEDFELNYGVGEYSHILAYNNENSRQIAISSGDNNLNYSLTNEQANDLLEGMMEKNVEDMAEKIKQKWLTEGSYQNIRFLEKELVNFYNKKFIKLSFSGTRNLNNVDYAYVMTDFITLFKTNNYQFLFESPKPKNELESVTWENLLFSTMAGVRISDGITQ